MTTNPSFSPDTRLEGALCQRVDPVAPRCLRRVDGYRDTHSGERGTGDASGGGGVDDDDAAARGRVLVCGDELEQDVDELGQRHAEGFRSLYRAAALLVG